MQAKAAAQIVVARAIDLRVDLTGDAMREAPAQTELLPASRSLWAARILAFAASSSRLFGGALVSSERRKLVEMRVISSMADRNAASFAFDGLLNPLIFLTNWREAARISSAVTGGSKLNRGLIFRHMQFWLNESAIETVPSRDKSS